MCSGIGVKGEARCRLGAAALATAAQELLLGLGGVVLDLWACGTGAVLGLVGHGLERRAYTALEVDKWGLY